MIATGEYGPSPDALGDVGLVPNAHRLVRSWSFEGDRLARAASSRPGGDVTLTVVGEDHLGQRATSRASFVETLRDYCERPQADALVCGD
jgi:hypothetical protein